MAMADNYEGQRVATCDCGAPLVHVQTATPDGQPVWTVQHTEDGWRQHLAAQDVARSAVAS